MDILRTMNGVRMLLAHSARTGNTSLLRAGTDSGPCWILCMDQKQARQQFPGKGLPLTQLDARAVHGTRLPVAVDLAVLDLLCSKAVAEISALRMLNAMHAAGRDDLAQQLASANKELAAKARRYRLAWFSAAVAMAACVAAIAR